MLDTMMIPVLAFTSTPSSATHSVYWARGIVFWARTHSSSGPCARKCDSHTQLHILASMISTMNTK